MEEHRLEGLHGWAISEYLHLTPATATRSSTPIGTQTVGHRITALKETISAIARDWHMIDDARTYLPGRALRSLPLIGSAQWDEKRAAAKQAALP